MSDFWPSSQPVWTEGGAILLLPLLVLLLLFLWMMLWFQRTSLTNEQSCCVVNINRKEANSRSRPFVDPSELISVSLQSPWQQGNNVEEERRGVVTNRVVCAGSEIESGERGAETRLSFLLLSFSGQTCVWGWWCYFSVSPKHSLLKFGFSSRQVSSVSFSCIIINAFVYFAWFCRKDA